MGFNSVYKVLVEVFPQVDARILRAVAIEHSKDADVAVEVVLVEVIPRLSQQSSTVGSADKSKSSLNLSEAIGGGKTAQLEVGVDPADVIPCLPEQSNVAGPSSCGGSIPCATEDAASSGQPNSPADAEPVTSGLVGISSFYDANGGTGTVSDGVPTPLEGCGYNNNVNTDGASSASICTSCSNDNDTQGCAEIGGENATTLSVEGMAGVSGSVNEDSFPLDITTPDTGNEYRQDFETEPIIAPTSSQLAGIVVTQLEAGSSSKDASEKEAFLQLDISTPDAGNKYRQDVETEPIIVPTGSQVSDIFVTQLETGISSKDTSEKEDFAIEIVSPDNDPIMSSTLTRSEQTCSTQLLEEIIEDAKTNKKVLVSAMDSVVNLMREVESKEKAAEQAKEEAACGCFDILAMADELKQALQRAKEGNDMHAGEVYAEKAILATEMKELQLRLFNLSDERNKSLEILDEMRIALDARLATALKEIEVAEQEKLGKKQSAREALAYEESQMEKVVEESKKLKLEAEENSKLQEFLMDRGRVIDMLQGEISVKCQDVKLLKEKFDKRIPLSRSLSSSQTSSILASSSSSFRSSRTVEPEPETSGTPKKPADLDDSYGILDRSERSPKSRIETDSYGFLERNERSPKSLIETVYSVEDSFPWGEEKVGDSKALIDDGWELFENGELGLHA